MHVKLISVVGVLAALSVPLCGQEGGAGKAAPDPAIAEQIKQLKSALTDRDKARDEEATGLIDKLLQSYPTLVGKDQVDVRKALRESLLLPAIKREPEKKGVFVAAAFALGRMESDGAKILAEAYKSDKFKHRDWIDMRAVFLKNIGTTKDPAQIDFLLERAARDPDDAIMRAAGEGLANYEDADEKVRKEIAHELIKKYAEVHGNAHKNVDPNDALVARERDRLNAISQAWNQTLSLMTGESFTKAPEWEKFWNKNKDKSWAKK